MCRYQYMRYLFTRNTTEWPYYLHSLNVNGAGMKPSFLIFPALIWLISAAQVFATDPPIGGLSIHPSHNYEYITFPEQSTDGKYCPIFSVGYGEHPESASQGFRLDIMDIVPGFFKTNAITARLYRANGESVGPTAEGKAMLNSPIYISTFSVPGQMPPAQVMTYFPWGPNSLEECWIEVSMGLERYWLEIPYGFDRNPADPLPPGVPGGRPQYVPAMKSLTDHDHVVRWLNVHYDLGVIQNGWRLSLIQSNPFDAQSEVELYRDDGAVGKSMYLWDLHTPRTSLRVIDADGSVIDGFCMDVHLHEDGLRRSDIFHIGRNGFGKERCWGHIEISVDGKNYQVIVPSSLYKYTHGHAPAK